MANISPIVLPLCQEQGREIYWSIGGGGDDFVISFVFSLSVFLVIHRMLSSFKEIYQDAEI